MPEYADKARYVGCITNQGLSKSQQKGTPCAVIEFQVMARVTGPSSVEDVPNKYKRTATIWLTEKTQEYAERDLANLGFVDFYTVEQLNLGHEDCIDLRGREVDFYCRHEASQNGDGKVYERWSVALQGERELEIIAVEKPEVRRLDALFAKGKKPTEKPVPVAQRQADFAPGITDDDVPF